VCQSANELKLSSVLISKFGVAEIEGSKQLILIPKDDIKRIKLKYGFVSKRPYMQAAIGLIIVIFGFAAGLIPLIKLLAAGANVGFNKLKAPGLILTWIPIGAWIILAGYKKSFYLQIETSKGGKNLVFQKGCDSESIKRFLKKANNEYDYNIIF
jgi:hypothetical protein